MIDALVRRVRSFTVGQPERKINNSSQGLDKLRFLSRRPPDALATGIVPPVGDYPCLNDQQT
ncbi:MAG: hypothetical protein ABWX59_05245 [Microbacteriaceae bacterium]